jgi:DNA-directed RNA polymerase specialized sigma24 family protein
MSSNTAARVASAPAAEEVFNVIYAAEHRRVGQYVYWHMPDSVRARHEDVTQEVFLGLWEHLQKGREVTHPFALLKRMAQRRIADQFAARRRDAGAVLVDVTDPAEPAVATMGTHSRYAAGEPEMAMVAAELETAMERMRDVSARWRDLHGRAGRMKAREGQRGPGVDPNPSRTAKVEAARIEIRRQRDEALMELQEACGLVGRLRAELERAGGDSWQSSCGWPPSAARDGSRRNGPLSDPTVKECPERHCLADIESVGFLEDGTRTCRACSTAATARHRAKATV